MNQIHTYMYRCYMVLLCITNYCYIMVIYSRGGLSVSVFFFVATAPFASFLRHTSTAGSGTVVPGILDVFCTAKPYMARGFAAKGGEEAQVQAVLSK